MARLLDKPLTNDEKIQILDSINGNICRISVSDDIEEIISQLNFAVDGLSTIAYSRVKELMNKEADNETD